MRFCSRNTRANCRPKRESRYSVSCMQHNHSRTLTRSSFFFFCTGRPCDDGRAASLTVGSIEHAPAVPDLFRQLARSMFALVAIMLLLPWLLTDVRGVFGLQRAHTVPSGSPD